MGHSLHLPSKIRALLMIHSIKILTVTLALCIKKRNQPKESHFPLRNCRPLMAAVFSLSIDLSQLIHLLPSRQSDTDRNPPHHSTTESLTPHAPDKGQNRNCQKGVSQFLDASSGHRTRKKKIQDSLET